MLKHVIAANLRFYGSTLSRVLYRYGPGSGPSLVLGLISGGLQALRERLRVADGPEEIADLEPTGAEVKMEKASFLIFCVLLAMVQ